MQIVGPNKQIIDMLLILNCSQLFGEEDPDQDVSPDTADPEAAGTGNQLIDIIFLRHYLLLFIRHGQSNLKAPVISPIHCCKYCKPWELTIHEHFSKEASTRTCESKYT